MEIKEMRELPGEELRLEIDKTREKIFRMRFHGKGKHLENPGLYKELKKEVARMSTVLSERSRKRELARAGQRQAAGGKLQVEGKGQRGPSASPLSSRGAEGSGTGSEGSNS